MIELNEVYLLAGKKVEVVDKIYYDEGVYGIVYVECDTPNASLQIQHQSVFENITTKFIEE